MSNLKDFIRNQKNKNQQLLSSSKANIALEIKNKNLLLSTQKSISAPEIDKFSTEISKIVQSEDFIDNLSNKIGKPLPDESEDAFINRAKQIMTTLLKNKLTK